MLIQQLYLKGSNMNFLLLGMTPGYFRNSSYSKTRRFRLWFPPGTTFMSILIDKFISETFTSLQSGDSHTWLITLPWRRAAWCLCFLWCHKIHHGSVLTKWRREGNAANTVMWIMIKSQLNSWSAVEHCSHGALGPFWESSNYSKGIFLPPLAWGIQIEEEHQTSLFPGQSS